MSGLLWLPRPFKEECPWKKFSQSVIGRPTILLHSSYLKDLAWADSELYHLGLIVAAQQVHK